VWGARGDCGVDKRRYTSPFFKREREERDRYTSPFLQKSNVIENKSLIVVNKIRRQEA
jgi:hypothetical protein